MVGNNRGRGICSVSELNSYSLELNSYSLLSTGHHVDTSFDANRVGRFFSTSFRLLPTAQKHNCNNKHPRSLITRPCVMSILPASSRSALSIDDDLGTTSFTKRVHHTRLILAVVRVHILDRQIAGLVMHIA